MSEWAAGGMVVWVGKGDREMVAVGGARVGVGSRQTTGVASRQCSYI